MNLTKMKGGEKEELSIDNIAGREVWPGKRQKFKIKVKRLGTKKSLFIMHLDLKHQSPNKSGSKDIT
jgi:hypothetical protein